MASKRKRGDAWEFTIKRAGVLDKPLYLTFDSEEEGDAYVTRVEAMLDRGIVPPELQTESSIRSIEDLVRMYMRDNAGVTEKDRGNLGTVCNAVGDTLLQVIDAAWVDRWISSMKREEKLAPATIRGKVGALARCCDWGMRRKLLLMPDHPLRTLPDGYAQYTDLDTALAGGIKRVDIERDRRLEHGEHEKIVKVLETGVLFRKQRPLELEYLPAVRCMYILAIESAMRLREMYTLTIDQVDLARRTVFLDRSKNGDKRQVPLSTVAVAVLKEYLKVREIPSEHPASNLFPWWTGALTEAELKKRSDVLSKMYSKVFNEAGCTGLKFHDLRHEATSRLFEKTTLSEIKIMKITGHKTQRMVMRYANLRGSNLADELW
jgi:integrase